MNEKKIIEKLMPYVPLPVFRQITQSGEDMPDERRQVTVLFADISGFTGWAENQDPEKVSRTINKILSGLAACIIKRDGTVDKFICDALMAVFGAPVTHPDDSRRALLAALEMKRVVRQFNSPGLDISVGIHTGLVISGNIGPAGRKEYSVLGDTVNIASRLEGLAKKGEILISTETLSEAGPLFYYGKKRCLKIKGREKPVNAVSLLKKREDIICHKLKPGRFFVGREEIIEELSGAVRRNTVLLLQGKAGIGKTTVIYNFVKSRPRNLRLFRCNAGLLSRARPLSLIQHIFRTGLKYTFTGRDNFSPKSAAKKMLGLLSSRPTLLVIEDLHLADEASLLVIKHLKETKNLACLFTSRPETGIEEALPNAEKIVLSELDPASRKELIRKLLSVKKLPRGIEPLAEDLGGIPLVLEETVRHLARQGHFYRERKTKAGRPGTPLRFWPAGRTEKNLFQIIRAGLDTLSPAARRLAERVSIFGLSAKKDLVTAGMSPKEKIQACNETGRKGILKLEGTELVFVHDIYRKVAYETQLFRSREKLHRQAADSFIRRKASPGLIAEHLMKAGREKKAFSYLIRAAGRAATFFAFSTCRDYLASALTIAKKNKMQDREALVLLKLAGIELRTSRNEEAGILLGRAEKIIRPSPDREMKLLFSQRQATFLKNTGDIAGMKTLCHGLLKKAPKNSSYYASALQTLGAQYWREGRYKKAITNYEKILTGKKVQKKTGILAASSLVDLYRMTGKIKKALFLLPRILRDRNSGWPLLHRGRLYLDQDKTGPARRDFIDALARAHKNEDPRLETLVLRELAKTEIKSGDNEKGITYAKSSLTVAEKVPAYAGRAYAEVALIYAQAGYFNEARNLIKTAKKYDKQIPLAETRAVLLKVGTILMEHFGQGKKAGRLNNS